MASSGGGPGLGVAFLALVAADIFICRIASSLPWLAIRASTGLFSRVQPRSRGGLTNQSEGQTEVQSCYYCTSMRALSDV
jgi:hypothetical protein